MRETQATPYRCVAGVINKRIYTYDAVLGWPWMRSSHIPARILQVYRGLNWVQSYIYSKWCQPYLILSRIHPWSSSSYGNLEQNVPSKHSRGAEEPLMAGVQLVGQPVVTSSQWLSPIDVNSVSHTQMHNPRNWRQTRMCWRFPFPKVIKQLILGGVSASRTSHEAQWPLSIG